MECSSKYDINEDFNDYFNYRVNNIVKNSFNPSLSLDFTSYGKKINLARDSTNKNTEEDGSTFSFDSKINNLYIRDLVKRDKSLKLRAKNEFFDDIIDFDEFDDNFGDSLYFIHIQKSAINGKDPKSVHENLSSSESERYSFISCSGKTRSSYKARMDSLRQIGEERIQKKIDKERRLTEMDLDKRSSYEKRRHDAKKLVKDHIKQYKNRSASSEKKNDKTKEVLKKMESERLAKMRKLYEKKVFGYSMPIRNPSKAASVISYI